MITFPNAKINIGLNITEKRPDGYHNLETIFYPIKFRTRWKSADSKTQIFLTNCASAAYRLKETKTATW